MGIYGQDWASYQTSQPDVSGLSFAFVKITEGLGYVNPKWTAQRDHAKRNGLVWGAYHYPHMANNAKAEADYFLAQVAWQPGDVIVLDWEGYDNANAGVSKARQLAYKEEWLRYVKTRMPRNRIGMYCNADYWRNVDTTGYYGDFLWIATASRAAGDPGIKADWLFHQYKASPVDTNYCHLATTADLRAWTLGTQPQEDDMSLTQQQADQLNFIATYGGWSYKGDGQRDAWGLLNNLVKQQAAMQAALAALAAAVGDGSDDVDTATLVAAVRQAIAEAVVDVNVHVHDDTTPGA